MDDRAITEYKLIIKVSDRRECAKYDPFGLCYVDDCMRCPNAKIKIIREDGIVMRDDFKNNRGTAREEKIRDFKRMFERNNIELFEEMYGVKFKRLQKWYLRRLFGRIKGEKCIK